MNRRDYAIHYSCCSQLAKHFCTSYRGGARKFFPRAWVLVHRMAAKSSPQLPFAGYENEFVDSIPDTLSCPICLLPFRDPHLVSCCGAKFCEACISRVKTAGQSCPLCKQEFISLLDRSFQRKVLELKVRCSKNSDGCQWLGELRHVLTHEREECGWAVMECSNQCGAHLPRRLMDEHQRDMCPQRSLGVNFETFMKRMEEELFAVKEELRKERETRTREVAELKQVIENMMAEQNTMAVSRVFTSTHMKALPYILRTSVNKTSNMHKIMCSKNQRQCRKKRRTLL